MLEKTMKKIFAFVLPFCLLASTALLADVVMEMSTSNAAGQESHRSMVYAKDNKLRMDGNGGGSSTSMVFLGNEALILDHQEMTYFVMDEDMVNEVSSKVSDAMKQMESQLAGLPPEQRAMLEQMMKGNMDKIMGQKDQKPAPTVAKVGSGEWKSFDCTRYEVYQEGEKTREICAAGLDDIEGGEEMMQSFKNMAKFVSKMTEAMPMANGGGLNPGELMDQLGGFPVHTVQYENGQIVGENSLESVTEEDVDPAMFEVPAGYTLQDPFKGM
jgi:hypothetical protein